jgi:hypothetical protein
MDGDVAQVVECLLCKCETLSSNPIQKKSSEKRLRLLSRVVAHACSPSYLRGGDQKDGSLKPAQAKSLRPHFK